MEMAFKDFQMEISMKVIITMESQMDMGYLNGKAAKYMKVIGIMV